MCVPHVVLDGSACSRSVQIESFVLHKYDITEFSFDTTNCDRRVIHISVTVFHRIHKNSRMMTFHSPALGRKSMTQT